MISGSPWGIGPIWIWHSSSSSLHIFFMLTTPGLSLWTVKWCMSLIPLIFLKVLSKKCAQSYVSTNVLPILVDREVVHVFHHSRLILVDHREVVHVFDPFYFFDGSVQKVRPVICVHKCVSGFITNRLCNVNR